MYDFKPKYHSMPCECGGRMVYLPRLDTNERIECMECHDVYIIIYDVVDSGSTVIRRTQRICPTQQG